MDTAGMSNRRDPTRSVTIQVPVYVPDYGVTRAWPMDHPLSIRVHSGEVVIEGDKIALRTLAELLLTLSEPDTGSSKLSGVEATTALSGGGAASAESL